MVAPLPAFRGNVDCCLKGFCPRHKLMFLLSTASIGNSLMFFGQCQGLTWLLAVGQGPRARVVAGIKEKDALGYGDGDFQNRFSLGFLQPWHRGRRELGGVRLQQQLLGDLLGVSARARPQEPGNGANCGETAPKLSRKKAEWHFQGESLVLCASPCSHYIPCSSCYICFKG